VYRDAPELTLVGFSKAHLAAGEARTITIEIARRRLQTWRGEWVDLPVNTLHIARSATEMVGRVAIGRRW
jgi:beta-glucosidase